MKDPQLINASSPRELSQTGSISELLLLINAANGVGHIYTCDYRVKDISLTSNACLSRQVHFSPFFIL